MAWERFLGCTQWPCPARPLLADTSMLATLPSAWHMNNAGLHKQPNFILLDAAVPHDGAECRKVHVMPTMQYVSPLSW